MAPEKSPAFQFYPKDFLTDERVRLMCHTERGVYITLLCVCWLHRSLPFEMKELAKMVEMPVQRFQRLWQNQLHQCFQAGEGGRLFHKRLDAERDKQETNRQRQSDRGKASAAAKLARFG